MKKIIFIILFVFIGLSSKAQVNFNETERVYLPEIEVDSRFLTMIDTVLIVESKESFYRDNFSYDIILLLDQHGNHCIQISAQGIRVPNIKGDRGTWSIWGIMNYKGHSFLFRGRDNEEIITITDNMEPFDFAVNQTRTMEDGTLLVDFIDDYIYGVWIFRYEDDEFRLVKRVESTLY